MKDGSGKAQPSKFTDQVDYQKGSVVSREIIRNEAGTVTLFAFDEGIIMPANEPHSVKAVKQFKMMLTMLKAKHGVQK